MLRTDKYVRMAERIRGCDFLSPLRAVERPVDVRADQLSGVVGAAFTTRFQVMGWSVGYATFIALCGIAALSVRNYSGNPVVAQPNVPAQAPG